MGRGLADDFTVEHPTGSGQRMRLRDVAADLSARLVSIWLPDAQGHRPVAGAIAKFRDDPEWRDLLLFHEYFHGETGAGIGASHQTGWTGLVAHLLCRGGPLDRSPADGSPNPRPWRPGHDGSNSRLDDPATSRRRVRGRATGAGGPRPRVADPRRRRRQPQPVGRERRPAIDRAAFDSSQAQLDLVAVGYSLGLACSVLWLGALGDRYGRKLMLILGMVLSIPACLLAAFAPTIEVLVLARIVGGFSAGMAYPTTLALIAALWSGPARTRSIALWSATRRRDRRAAGRSSPGSCSSTSTWGSVFLVTLPLAAVALVMALAVRAGPRQRDDRAGRQPRRHPVGRSSSAR